MMRFRSLEFLDRIQFVFIRMGIDYPVMRRVLALKLMMDTRRVPTVLQNKNNNENDEGNKMMKSLWMYALLSIIPGVMTFMSSSVFSKVCYIMGIAMFFTMTTMISDFSSVLLDIRDKNILMTLPVHSRTMAAAKTIHIAIYLSMISLTLNLFPIAGMVYNHGILNGLLYIIMLVFMVLSVMGVCLPIVFLMVHVKLVSPAFERYPSKLNSSGEKPSVTYFRRLRFREKLSRIMARNLSERASLKFGYSILTSEREMKQKVYPGIALSMILPFIFALPYHQVCQHTDIHRNTHCSRARSDSTMENDHECRLGGYTI